jgi:hypothetical protein
MSNTLQLRQLRVNYFRFRRAAPLGGANGRMAWFTPPLATSKCYTGQKTYIYICKTAILT